MSAQLAETPPNIVLVVSDQHRFDVLGCNGSQTVQTPNIDALASEGTRFTRAYCTSPICQPSRASLLTGRSVASHGVWNNWERDFDPAWDTIANAVKRAGYSTAYIGKTHYYNWPEDVVTELARGDGASREVLDLRTRNSFVQGFGWDHVVEEFDRYVHAAGNVVTPYLQYLADRGLDEAYRKQVRSVMRLTPEHWRGVESVLAQENDLTSFLGDQAVEWLGAVDASAPFMLQVGFVQPHPPLIADPVWSAHYRGVAAHPGPRERQISSVPVWGRYLADQYRRSNTELLSEEYLAAATRQYYGMVSRVDDMVGRIWDVLKHRDLARRTLFIYTADHGEMLGDYRLMGKSLFFGGSAKVPLVVRWPAGTDLPEVVDRPTSLLDIPATVASMAGVTLPGAEGGDLCRLAHDDGIGGNLVFSEIQGPPGAPGHFVAAFGDRYRVTIEASTGVCCEVFDLATDPDERENLAGGPAERDPEIAAILQEARHRAALAVAGLSGVD